MIHKLSAFLLVIGLAFQTTAFAVTTPNAKRGELPPELKENALKLLSLVARETGQFNLPENRVRAQTIVADLLWEQDEREARLFFQNAFAELQNLIANINPPEGVEMTAAEKNLHYSVRYSLADLRREYVLTLALRDSRAALDALDALKTKTLAIEYDPLDSTDLELRVTAAIVKKDPDKSYSVAKAQLDANGVNYQFVEALKSLHRKNSRLAADLGKDVLAKIKSAKIRPPSSPSSAENKTDEETVAATTVKATEEIEFYQVLFFVTAAAEMNRRAASDKEKKMLPLFSDAEMKELVELLAGAFLAARNPDQYAISQAMSEISRYSPEAAQRIRLRLGAKAAKELDRIVESNSYSVSRNEKSADELAQDADRAAPDVRDQRYSDAAFKALEEGEAEKAQAIAARIKDRKNYAYLLEQIEAALPLAKARRGDLKEVRLMLVALKTNGERIAALTELALALGAKGEKETAKTLLDESLQMLPAPLKNESDLDSAAKVAVAYASVAPEQAFMIVESGIGQMNEYISAGIKLDEFFGGGSVETNELLFNSMMRQILMRVPNSTEMIKNLALADFERAVSLADRFERPEIRLLVRLRIAQALLDREAVEKEKKMREQLTSNDEMN